MIARTLALIPARGGSKRLPRKNIRELAGRPMIAHTIEAALSAVTVDRVVVSTEDEEIARIALACGADVPFMRPAALAEDATADPPVTLHALRWLEQNDRRESFDLVAYLRPTSPFRSSQLIDRCVSQLSSRAEWTALRTVCRAEGKLHPYWIFRDDGGVLRPFIGGIEMKEYYQSQLLPQCFRLNGVVDVLRTRQISTEDQFGPEVGHIEIDAELAIDVDTALDLEYCEFLFERRRHASSSPNFRPS